MSTIQYDTFYQMKFRSVFTKCIKQSRISSPRQAHLYLEKSAMYNLGLF